MDVVTWRGRLRRGVPKLALVVWFAATVGVAAIMLGRHLVALPRPVLDDAGRAMLAEIRGLTPTGKPLAVHVLYTECRCSQRIAQHLLESTRPEGVDEKVLLVGASSPLEASLRGRGFVVERLTPDELASRYGIRAVPLLVVLGSGGDVRYAGGYTERKQGPDPRDLELIARALDGSPLDAMPVFGCAISKELRDRLDPTGVL